MIKETYKFDTRETFRGAWLILWIVTIFLWLGFPTYYNWGHLKLEDYFALPVLIFPGFMLVLFLISWLWSRGLCYEVSSTRLAKKRGERILRSVEISDVQGIVERTPIRLKIADQRDFIFDGIIIGSSYKKLESLLQELGITKIKKKINIQEIVRRLLLVLTFFVVLHFVVSIVAWYLFGLHIPLKYRKDYPIDWVMLLHAIPAIMLLGVSISAFISAYRKKIRKSLITLGLVLVISVLCFFIETTNKLFQAFYSGDVIGGPEFLQKSAKRYHYFNWWWYNIVVAYPDMFSEVTYKRGYINKTGQFVAEPQFNYASDFSDGLAQVIGNKMGYIDTNGVLVISHNFDSSRDFHEGLATVAIEDKWGYIDKTGKVVIEPVFKHADSFSEGLAAVEIDKKWGYINQEGELTIKYKFDGARYFKEGLASVSIGEKYSFINRKGEFAIKPEFDYASDFSEGLAAVEIDGKDTYIDKTGQLITERRFDEARFFSEGLAAVRIDHKWGYIGKDGQIVIECQYERVYGFSDGIAVVCKHNGKWGYRSDFLYSLIKQNGEKITDLEFSLVMPFSEGLAEVENEDGYCGYIDRKGEIVIPCQFDSARPFSEGLARIGVEIAKEEGN